MSEFLLHAHHLGVRIAGVPILKDVHLSVAPREIVTLIGPNGSGKTTLLRALVGLVPFDGAVQKKPGLRIGYVPQHFARDRAMPLTVARFMRLFGGATGPAIAAALGRTGVENMAGRQMAALSGGELARVLLARAIARRPDLLMLDEPLAAVDVAGEAALYRLIADLRVQMGCAVLLVSHDLHIVMGQADRVICLNGHVCCEGPVESVVQNPAFTDLFGPRAARELGLYAHHHDHRHDTAGAIVTPGHEGHRHA
jgi:zinc transport system ATP-binding protein